MVFAQEAETTLDANNDGDVDNKFGYKISVDEYAQYSQAIETCDTPSLECLVHYTTRFAAMEWALDIAQGKIGAVDTATGGDGTINDTGKGGVFAGVMNLTGAMYNHPPAHTASYVADVVNTTGFAQPAYAQGLGFASLDPILNLWKVFRNIAYFFFIIIFVVIGFMIMLRKRISGQAAVTAQQAIPSVIISLILVTFSYAIAGFMVDLMYVLMFLIIGLFNGISFDYGGGTLTGESIINFSILHLIGFLFTANVSGQALSDNYNLVSGILSSAAGTEGAIFSYGGAIGGLTLSLVIAVAVLIGAVRLFFELLKSYAAIILYIVASPLILMFGAIPGKDVFWPWLKGILGNLLAFPAVLLMLIIYIEFTARGASDITVTGGSEGGFMPPFLLGNGTAGNMVGPLLGLAIILGLPDIIKEIKKAAGAGEGGIGSMLAGFAWGGLQRGWNGDKYAPIPGVRHMADAFPLGFGDTTPFRTTGKESLVERALIGTRANRAKEVERRRQAEVFGTTWDVRQGGLYGLFVNKAIDRQNATRATGSGAGAAPAGAATPAAGGTPAAGTTPPAGTPPTPITP
jgi:hypothetical protein